MSDRSDKDDRDDDDSSPPPAPLKGELIAKIHHLLARSTTIATATSSASREEALQQALAQSYQSLQQHSRSLDSELQTKRDYLKKLQIRELHLNEIDLEETSPTEPTIPLRFQALRARFQYVCEVLHLPELLTVYDTLEQRSETDDPYVVVEDKRLRDVLQSCTIPYKHDPTRIKLLL